MAALSSPGRCQKGARAKVVASERPARHPAAHTVPQYAAGAMVLNIVAREARARPVGQVMAALAAMDRSPQFGG